MDKLRVRRSPKVCFAVACKVIACNIKRWAKAYAGPYNALQYLVRFRVTDGGQASEPAGYSSVSLGCSVTRAAIENSVPYLLPILNNEVRLLCVKNHPE